MVWNNIITKNQTRYQWAMNKKGRYTNITKKYARNQKQ